MSSTRSGPRPAAPGPASPPGYAYPLAMAAAVFYYAMAAALVLGFLACLFHPGTRVTGDGPEAGAGPAGPEDERVGGTPGD